MKKKLFIAILLALPLAGFAQSKKTTKPEAAPGNKWEATREVATEAPTENPLARYLDGAVPVVNGRVQWSLSLDVPGKSAQEIYDRMGQFLNDMTHEENQTEHSRIALADETSHTIACKFHEWLVFQSTFLSLDQTEFDYVIKAVCRDGHADVTMEHINYMYERNRKGGTKHKAEDWITDKYAMNKSKTKLLPISGKFRRKTIDRKDEIFKKINDTLLN